jgi:hypothetical protein
MAEWTAEITNDPDHDYDLYIELLEGDEYRGRIFRTTSGELALGLYEGHSAIEIPLDWLLKVAEGAKRDLAHS